MFVFGFLFTSAFGGFFVTTLDYSSRRFLRALSLYWFQFLRRINRVLRLINKIYIHTVMYNLFHLIFCKTRELLKHAKLNCYSNTPKHRTENAHYGFTVLHFSAHKNLVMIFGKSVQKNVVSFALYVYRDNAS